MPARRASPIPGVELVEACIKAQIPVDPIPGASAPLAAAVASGFPLIPLTIFGFPPRRSKDRKMWFSEILCRSRTLSRSSRARTESCATLSEARRYIGRKTNYARAGAHEASSGVLRGSAAGGAGHNSGSPRGRSQSWLAQQNHDDLSNDQLIAGRRRGHGRRQVWPTNQSRPIPAASHD